MTFRFRDSFYSLVTSWLSRGDGERVLYSLGLLLDAFSTRARAGLEARFPRRAGTEALALIGADRAILRGRSETAAGYAERLLRWRTPRGHRTRGTAFALLEQVSTYFGGIRCWTIDARGNRHVRDLGGAESFSYGYAWNWDGAPAQPAWGRFWLVLEPRPPLGVAKHPAIDDPTLWGGLSFDAAAAAGYVLDCVGVVRADVQAIVRLVQGRDAWRPAHGIPVFAVVVLSDYTTVPDPSPTGTWGTWTGRDSAYAYWNLSHA